jgi:polyphosphate glucokinase
MPGPIKDGKLKAIANLHKSWVGERADAIFTKASGRRVTVLNDADAAGLAEMKFGAGRKQSGVVVLVTLGTGIGSALFANGCLVPNTEFGQMEIGGRTAEQRASAKVRKQKKLSWEKWAKRLESYLCRLEALLYPDLIIVGGGVSRRSKKFLPLVNTRARILPARLRNEAGIVGAALAAIRPSTR